MNWRIAGNNPRAQAEGAPGLLVGDQVEIALAVFDLLVGQAVELVRQRAQRLGQQAQAMGVDGQLAVVGLEQHAFDTEDVAQVPVLEGLVRVGAGVVVGNVDLDAAAAVLQGGETGLAHHPLEHHAAGQGNGRRRMGFQFLLGLVSQAGVQVGGMVAPLEVIGEGEALFAQRSEFLPPFLHDLVFVLSRRYQRFGHGGLGRAKEVSPHTMGRAGMASF